MKISTRGRYAVMAMVDIANHQKETEEPNGASIDNRAMPEVCLTVVSAPVSLTVISKRQEIPLPYLEQIFQDLRKAGQVKSVRGPKGGFKLAKPAHQTLIGDIINSVDETVEVTRCSGTNMCLSKHLLKHGRCLTHDLWAELESQISGFLNGVSLADVLAGDLAFPRPIRVEQNMLMISDEVLS